MRFSVRFLGKFAKISAVNGRFLFVCAALLVLRANVALGDGSYLRTKDEKTMVWNNEPKVGDVAAWSGDRDKEGYATGYGTLTWYTVEKESVRRFGVPIPFSAAPDVYARYFGNMVHGKFDGVVNVHSKRKTAHAIFVDGRRTGRWTAGPALSRRVPGRRVEPAKKPEATVAEAETVQRRTPNAQRPKSEPPRAVAEKMDQSDRAKAETEPEAPAEGPRNARTVAKAENAQHPTQDKPDAKAEDENRVGKEADTEPARPTPAPSVGLAVDANRPVDRAVPIPAAGTGRAEKPKTEVDDSLRHVIGPPSSLRTDPNGNVSDVGAKTEAASSSGANARLTKEEVVDLADAEARARGYNPAEYQRPEPRFNTAYGTWSLGYDQKQDVSGMSETGQHFSVTIDDKTKGIVFVPGK
jgi:hypothetical protein